MIGSVPRVYPSELLPLPLTLTAYHWLWVGSQRGWVPGLTPSPTATAVIPPTPSRVPCLSLQEGILAYDVASTLVHNVDAIMTTSGNFFGLDGLQKHWSPLRWTRGLRRLPGLDKFVARLLFSRFQFGYALGLGFVATTEELSHVCHQLIEDNEVSSSSVGTTP